MSFRRTKPAVATIGLFDGVHRGHEQILKRTRELASRRGMTTMAITLDRHPLSVFKPEESPGLLTSTDDKIRLLKALGIDQVVVLEFTKTFATLSAREFLDKVIRPLNVGHVVVGEGFRFGKNRRGDAKLIEEYGKKHGLGLTVQPLVKVDAQKVSSSHIRTLLRKGSIEEAAEMLGRYPSYRGRVVQGAGRGKSLGFPTANIELPQDLCLPRSGVYAGYITLAGGRRKCLVNVGLAPTFGERKKPLLEAHCLKATGDILGREVEIQLKGRIRDEVTFPDEESLAVQLGKDAKEAEGMLR